MTRVKSSTTTATGRAGKMFLPTALAVVMLMLPAAKALGITSGITNGGITTGGITSGIFGGGGTTSTTTSTGDLLGIISGLLAGNIGLGSDLNSNVVGGVAGSLALLAAALKAPLVALYQISAEVVVMVALILFISYIASLLGIDEFHRRTGSVDDSSSSRGLFSSVLESDALQGLTDTVYSAIDNFPFHDFLEALDTRY